MKRTLPTLLSASILAVLFVFAAPLASADGLQEPKVGVGVDLEGYYRVRFDNFLDVGWINSSDEEWVEYFDQRFRLNPTLTINDRIVLNVQLDMLRDVLFGQSKLTANPVVEVTRSQQGETDVPEITDVDLGSVNFADGNVFTERPSNTDKDGEEVPGIELTRVWGAVLLPFGRFEFGRMPAHWGMGLLNNDGNGIDDDFGDTFDRILFATKIGPVIPELSYSRLSEGRISYGLSDIHQVNFNLRYLSDPISAGAYVAWRQQGKTDTSMMFYDLWVRGQVEGVVMEAEIAAVQGQTVQIERDDVRDLRDAGFAIGEGGGKIDISAYIAAMRIDYSTPTWGVGGGTGVSSPADASDGGEFDAAAAAAVQEAKETWEADPDSASKRIDFLNTVISNKEAFAKSMNSYPMDPDFRVDLLIWKELMGGSIYNGVYARAWGEANPFRWMSIRAAVIKSWVNEPGKARDGSDASQDAGWEMDWDIGFSMADYFSLNLQFGYAWIGDYFVDKYRAAQDPFTMQANFAIQF